MFIYFPEFIFKTFKVFINNSFPKINPDKANDIVQLEVFSPKYAKLLQDFKEEKLKLPKINLDHCISISVHNFLGVKSSYSYLDNTISICYNHIQTYNEIPAILNKEMLYAYDMNVKYKNQNKLSLNNQACGSIRACR